MISKKLQETIKLSNMKSYQIAHKAGLHYSTLSRLINGIDKVKRDDPRVIAVGRVLGIPPNGCFEKAEQTNEAFV